MDPRIERIKNAADYLTGVLAGRQPRIGIVLGSGLGKLADQIADPLVIPYKDIPGFPVSTAIGHKGNFIVGTLGGKTVIASGRFVMRDRVIPGEAEILTEARKVLKQIQ